MNQTQTADAAQRVEAFIDAWTGRGEHSNIDPDQVYALWADPDADEPVTLTITDLRALVERAKLQRADEILESVGVPRDRLQAAIDSSDSWGKMIHAFEYCSAVGAVLASWKPEATA